jgi:uncharacterized protein involved in response to NO
VTIPNEPRTSAPGEFIPPGVVTMSNALLAASLWRREPYRVFFPLGAAMAAVGVGHWLLHALGLLADYRSTFHSTIQIQAFLSSFAVGFLFTMIPRRTGSTPPSTAEMLVCGVAPIATCVAAWNERTVVAQLAWLALALTVVQFALRRFLSASSRRRPPNSFVWIPLSFAMGIAGAIMTIVYALRGEEPTWLFEIGRGLSLQGVFIGLVLGVGGLALPLMTRGEPPPDGVSTIRDVARRFAHALAALLVAGSFAVQALYSVRAGLGLRGVVVLGVLLLSTEIWRAPTMPGLNRRVIWVAVWQLPLGLLLAAAYPAAFKAGLHVAFIGGFAMLTLAVSTQVTLGHGGYSELLAGRSWQLAAIAGLVSFAVVPRALMDLDPARFYLWMALASASFLTGLAVWAAFLLPKMVSAELASRKRRE